MEYEITKKVSPPHGVWNLILNGRVWRFFGKQQYNKGKQTMSVFVKRLHSSLKSLCQKAQHSIVLECCNVINIFIFFEFQIFFIFYFYFYDFQAGRRYTALLR
jgi:hypothetical protein